MVRTSTFLGVREPHIYGSTTLAAIKDSCEEFAKFARARLSFHQSNHEGALVDLIQSAREEADAIIINPAAYSFTSIAMFDALKTFEGSDHRGAYFQYPRPGRIASSFEAVIRRQSGRLRLGPYGYIIAMQAALQILGKLPASLPAPIRVGPR